MTLKSQDIYVISVDERGQLKATLELNRALRRVTKMKKPDKKVLKKRWNEDLTKCPDCGLVQKKPKIKGDHCENPECESYVMLYKDGKLRWWNENWG